VTANTLKPDRLPLLDGLRGLAAMLVVMMHSADMIVDTAIFRHGYLAVDLFFLLSGFVLTLAFEPRFAAGMNMLNFMKLRIVRLWPTVAIGMAIASILIFTVTPPGIATKALALNLMMIPASCDGKALYCLNGPAWSLACEFAANLLHVWILWKLSDRALLMVAAMAGVLLAFAIVRHGNADMGVLVGDFWGGYLRCAFGYTLGMWMARKWRNAPGWPLPWWLGLMPAVAVPFGIQQLGTPSALIDALACLVILPACFWLATQGKLPTSLRPAMDWLGRHSYPLYAVNLPIKNLTMYLALSLGMARGMAMMALVIVLSLLASELVLHLGLGGQSVKAARNPLKPASI
jgi:peptidoglycan/LPS O-acetylase OafA/YrhL